MSLTPEQSAEIVAIFSSIRTDNLVAIASDAFFAYDYVITLIREVELIWRGRCSLASALFVVIRYPTLVSNFLGIPQNYARTSSSCDMLIRTAAIIGYLRYLPFALFSGLRAYALCRSWTLSGLITLLALAPLGVNFTQYAIGIKGYIDPLFGCAQVVNAIPKGKIIFPIVSRGGLVLSDLLLIILTWRTLGSGPLPRVHLTERGRMTFSGIVLWNGLLYFVLLFVMNVLHLALTLSSTFGLAIGNGTTSYLTFFTNPLTTILIYRFILDLQEANRQEMKLSTEDPLHFSLDSSATLSFARVIGSLGSTIVPGSTTTAHDEDQFEEYQKKKNVNIPLLPIERQDTLRSVEGQHGIPWAEGR